MSLNNHEETSSPAVVVSKDGHQKSSSILSAEDDLLTENRNIKEQVGLLQDRLRQAQALEAARSAELQTAQREADELQQRLATAARHQAEHAQLQVISRFLFPENNLFLIFKLN